MKSMKRIFFLLVALFLVRNASGNAPRVVDLKTPDGIILKGTYFAAAKPGAGVLLLHQSNRDRKSWDGLAAQLAKAGINTLTLDMRGFGESGGTRTESKRLPEDVDTALEFLISQPGVERQIIGLGGAGWLGVLYSVEAARRHPKDIKSLVLMSGETGRDGLQFLHQASQLPELFVFSDDRRISANARRDETALRHSIQPQQETGALLGCRGCAVALVRDVRHRRFPLTVAMARICSRCTPSCPGSSLNGLSPR